ncbi:MAG: hypothetical protein AAF889_10210 [Cyanobacteria bacterium P01_D01_bin.73]
MSKLESEKLAKILQLIASRLSELGDIELLDVDMYWTISPPEAYDMSQIPKPEVGSLSEDLEGLLELYDESRPFKISDLDKLAPLLNLISETLVPTSQIPSPPRDDDCHQ